LPRHASIHQFHCLALALKQFFSPTHHLPPDT
jgi:hypothetical protein